MNNFLWGLFIGVVFAFIAGLIGITLHHLWATYRGRRRNPPR